MPLYEYQCDACGFRFEVIQRFSDAPVENCQSCGGPVHKLFSSPAIQFKGSGWYITDYARKGMKGSASEGESADAKAKADASPAKTEPAAKPPAKSSPQD
jgi:putative FmdB family regulatory protein